jgi:hypothetical protein
VLGTSLGVHEPKDNSGRGKNRDGFQSEDSAEDSKEEKRDPERS